MPRILVDILATNRSRATGTPELADTGDALKLADTEDAVVGPPRSGASLRPPPRLASGPKHGHAMIEDIAALCGARLGPRALYGAIARLERQGWIEPLPAEERRRPFRITPQGAKVLRAKLMTLRKFVEAGTRRLGAA